MVNEAVLQKILSTLDARQGVVDQNDPLVPEDAKDNGISIDGGRFFGGIRGIELWSEILHELLYLVPGPEEVTQLLEWQVPRQSIYTRQELKELACLGEMGAEELTQRHNVRFRSSVELAQDIFGAEVVIENDVD